MRQTIYVETSALVRAVLEGDMPVLSPALTARLRLTSVLTAVETERALLKAFLDKRISAEQRREARGWLRSFLATCELLELEQDVLDRAEQPFPVEPIRTLDALHVSSAVLFEQRVGEPLAVLSVDNRVRQNVDALGFDVLPADH